MPLQIFDFDLELQYKFMTGWSFLFDIILKFSHIDIFLSNVQIDISLQIIYGYGSDSKASVYNVGDLGSIPGLGRSPGEGSGTPLQYYCLENPMDRGAW